MGAIQEYKIPYSINLSLLHILTLAKVLCIKKQKG